MKKTRILWLSLFVGAVLFNTNPGFCKRVELLSPDERIMISVDSGDQVKFSITVDQKEIVSVSGISMTFADQGVLGRDVEITDVRRNTVSRRVKPAIKEKSNVIQERYNELRLDFGQQYVLTLRAYDDGVAYRFSTSFAGDVTIQSEQNRFHFKSKSFVYCQKEKSFRSSYEKPYSHVPIQELTIGDLCCLPLLVDIANGPKVVITESDLEDYPGMWLRGTGEASLEAAFAGYPLKESYEGRAYGHGRVTEHADYIAKTRGTRTYPWRVIAIARQDQDLITNQLVYLLAKPLQLEDVSWIRPGKVTFDWWARRNIYGTNFKAGVNTETAKYFIDFAADYGIEYFLFDDGWSNRKDLLDVNSELDMDVITAYAKQKNVGIMLWMVWATLDRQCEQVLDRFSQWGIKGIKIDFMNRDDQKMVNFYHRIAQEAAKRHMVIDFHGSYKPAGLRRAYPNVLTREGLIEFEYNGWTDHANPEHHTLLPFIRMVAGPMDYIPGTMNNAQKKNFRPVGDRPMGQGTRAHSIALFVILESPMQMLPDAPSDYYREHECMEFISHIPVVWDETRVLEAKVGDYVVLARRDGSEWFVGAITDWQSREFDIRFDFLDEGPYQIEVIKDGLNADIRAIDYKKVTGTIRKGEIRTIKLAPGGGWIARIYKTKIKDMK